MNPLGPYVHARFDDFEAQRPLGADEDIHILRSLADLVISRCSRPGDVVLDPFAGFGGALAAAVAAGRQAIGVELLPERVAHIADHIPAAEIIEGDARGLATLITSPVDLCLTSPPYMTANLHPADPLTAYELDNASYSTYLDQLTNIALQVDRLLRPGGFMVWNAANIRFAGHTTSLAWDVAARLSEHFDFLGETTVVWDHLPHDFTGDYLLVFQKPRSASC